uniref:TNFR-Cys domain-containing protein n=1 Tax=Echeneis naucrates TaxID=173247 RepID=A0A665TK83_ECHNA
CLQVRPSPISTVTRRSAGRAHSAPTPMTPSNSGRCMPCTVCPVGQGVFAHCDHNHDTVCEMCVDDTFSDRESSLEPCLPCAICDDETEIQKATQQKNLFPTTGCDFRRNMRLWFVLRKCSSVSHLLCFFPDFGWRHFSCE